MPVANDVHDTSSDALAWALAGAAWVSQVPYFLWDVRQPAPVASGALLGLVAAVRFWRRRQAPIARRDWLAGAGLACLLIYITAQKTVAGGHAMWVFVLPTVFALVVATLADKRAALTHFEFLFVVSLIPGMIVLLALIAGIPVEFGLRLPPNVLFANAGERILTWWGAVFIESNSQLLPWGGIVSRLSGMFDEPGMVGTMAALMLSVRGFRIADWRAVLLWAAGTLSISLAFVALAGGGLLLRAVLRREWGSALLALPVIGMGLFAVGLYRPTITPGVVPAASVRLADGSVRRVLDLTPSAPAPTPAPTPAPAPKPSPPPAAAPPPGLPAPPVHAPPPTPPHAGRVRQTTKLNNRSLPEMDALVERYWASGWRVVTFGLASDASVVYGGASAVWTRVLTNHGLFGLGLLAAVFVGYAATSVPRRRDTFALLAFLGSFGLSFYQRPVIWLPYALLMFFGGLAALERDDSPPR